jgi:glycosyltransferase involved in cell wall biosynthesis
VQHIQWDALSQAFCLPAPKVAVINTFSIYPATGGGQIRMLQLYGEVARRMDVRVVNLSHSAHEKCVRTLAPGLQEVVVPMTPEHREFEVRLSAELRASCVDIAAMLKPELSPDWLAEIKAACGWADLVIASHCYGYPAIRNVWDGPVIYEGHNVEADLKNAIFGHARHMVEKVQEVEGACARQAPHIFCCSPEDSARMQQLYGLGQLPGVVPNGVDLRAYAPTTASQRKAIRLRLGLTGHAVALFVGSLHGPNVDALLALLPVARQCPEVLFAVVGSVCESGAILDAGPLPPNVRLLGRVSASELRVWLAAADVGVNPMVSGSGTNLKMLEFAAAGLPMLSTPFGGRGGVFTAGEHYESAELDEFAQRLRRILAPACADSLERRASASRQCVAERGDWRVVARNMSNDLAGIQIDH